MNAAIRFMQEAQNLLARIIDTEMPAIEQAADICANTIANEGLVHMFGTGHSRILTEEMYPRHGSFPGFHSIVELSMTFHNQVVGANGQRQAMFIEHIEGLAEQILRNFVISAPDSFMVFSNSGVNEVVVDMALQAKKRDLPLIVIVSKAHCAASSPKHSSGKKLIDIADVVIDNGTPAGDAMVNIENLGVPVGPGSTVGGAAIINAIKSLTAEKLVAQGVMPKVLTSSVLIGSEASNQGFEDSYDDYRRRMLRAYGGK